MDSSVPIGFIAFSWILLLIPIWIFNLVFMNDYSRNKISNILENGICLNPFNRILFKRAPVMLFKLFGLILAAFYLSIVYDLIQAPALGNESHNLFRRIIYLSVNFLLQFWLLYFLGRLKTAFDNGRLRVGLLYEEIAVTMGALPRWCIPLILAAQGIIYFIYFIKLLR